MGRRLCDGGEPWWLWIDEEDNGGGWIRMMAVAVTETMVGYPLQ
nr:hypothetical protein [Tanacetum cinerariifolium]